MSESFLKKDLEGLESIDFLDDEHISELAKKYDVSKQSSYSACDAWVYKPHSVTLVSADAISLFKDKAKRKIQSYSLENSKQDMSRSDRNSGPVSRWPESF